MISPANQSGLLTGRQLVLLGTAALHALVYQILSLTLGFHPVGDAADHIMKAFFFEEPVMQRPIVLQPRVPVPNPDTDSLLKDPPLPTPWLYPEQTEAGPGDRVVSQGQGDGTEAGSGTPGETPPTELRYTTLRPTQDFYPPTSIRLNEEGVTVLRVCVTAAGALLGPPVVTSGSGHPRLDMAALVWASQALRFSPATRNGAPVEACKGFRVSFRLHD